MRVILLLLFFPVVLRGAIVAHEQTGLIRRAFALKEVCRRSGHDPLLATPLDLTKVDCMGTEVAASDFCRKTLSGSDFTRGFIAGGENIICERAQSVHLSLDCNGDKRPSSPCREKDATEACARLGRVFAASHHIFHASRTGPSPFEAPTQLNCLFMASAPR